MRSVIDFIEALKVPILEVRWWERDSILTKAQIGSIGLNRDFVLASHETPAGFVPVLLWYAQYYWSVNITPGEIFHMPAATGYWRVNVGGEPPDEQLANLRHVRKPWNGYVGALQPCFYIGPITNTKHITEILIHLILDLDIGDYVVGGFITGVDIPRQYFDKELLERAREER